MAAPAALEVARRLLAVATAERLDDLLTTCDLASLGEAEAAIVRADARAKLQGLRELATVLDAADDEDQLYRTVASFWLEQRCEWYRYNTLMNYVLATGGDDAPQMAVQAAVSSAMMAWLEEVVPAGAFEPIGAAAQELLEQLRADVLAGRLGGAPAPVA